MHMHTAAHWKCYAYPGSGRTYPRTRSMQRAIPTLARMSAAVRTSPSIQRARNMSSLDVASIQKGAQESMADVANKIPWLLNPAVMRPKLSCFRLAFARFPLHCPIAIYLSY